MMLSRVFSRVRRTCLRVLTLFCVLVCFVIVREVVTTLHKTCSNDVSRTEIENLCSKYHRQEAIGNMCPKLCDDKTLHLQHCGGNNGRKVVSFMECSDCLGRETSATTVVMKERRDLAVPWGQTLAGASSPTDKVQSVKTHIRGIIQAYFNVKLSLQSDVLSKVFMTHNEDQILSMNNSKVLDSVLQSAIKLAEQEEFGTHRFLGLDLYMPKMYGTCGGAYFVEFTPSLSNMHYIMFEGTKQDMVNMNLFFPSWTERAGVALEFLKLVADVEDKYPTPLQICDPAPHNIGIKGDGTLSFLDADSVRFNVPMPLDRCDADETCSFGDCRGVCNRTTNVCDAELTTTNLQIICQRIFITKHESFGLLRGAPSGVHKELRELLKQCVHPPERTHRLSVDNKSDRKLLFRLEYLLRPSIGNV